MSGYDDSYLEEIITSSTEVIQEAVFVNRYLPMLFDPDPSKFNMHWLNEVAKNPHTRVYVRNAKDELIFSVPPLRTSPLTDRTEHVVRALNLIRLQANMNTAHAAAMLDMNLPHMIDIKTTIDDTFVKEWQDILTRYNYNYQHPSSDGIEENGEFLDSGDDDW